jgi:hypothetical protein
LRFSSPVENNNDTSTAFSNGLENAAEHSFLLSEHTESKKLYVKPMTDKAKKEKQMCQTIA